MDCAGLGLVSWRIARPPPCRFFTFLHPRVPGIVTALFGHRHERTGREGAAPVAEAGRFGLRGVIPAPGPLKAPVSLLVTKGACSQRPGHFLNWAARDLHACQKI